MTVALWTGARAWMLGATLYLPDAWLTTAQRLRARIPARVQAQPKWQLALTLVRQVRACGIRVTAVLGDAEFGESATLRRALHRLQLSYALGVSSTLKVFVGRPALIPPPASATTGRPRSRPTLAPHVVAIDARAWAAAQPARAWRVVSWRNGAQPAWRARFCATRVTPAHDWRDRRLAPDVWLLCERALGASDHTKVLPGASPADRVAARARARLTHQRWAIEQQYQELKDELGLDHFEGRTLPGWQRHVVLTALAYTWLQIERQRRGTHLPTLPIVRAVITEILTAHFFVTRPHYLQTMQKLAEINLRI